MSKLSISSENYLLYVKDLLKLKKSKYYIEDKDEVIILIQPNKEDTLIAGYNLIKNTDEEYFKAKVAYLGFNPVTGFLTHLHKKTKKSSYFTGSGVYRTKLSDILAKNILRGERNQENAYTGSSKVWQISDKEKKNKYKKLQKSLKTNGYDYSQPIEVALNRKMGHKDQLFQGHHRIGAAIDVKVEDISITFGAFPSSCNFFTI